MTRSRSTDRELAGFLDRHPEWCVNGTTLQRSFQLGSFERAIEFMRACQATIDRLDHHPVWSNRYATVHVELSTHSIGAISPLDLELAAMMDRIATDPRVVAVDWSGRVVGSEETIWLAEARGETLIRLEPGRTRDEITDWLLAAASSGASVIAGLDFAFSLPAWFARAHGCSSGPDVWELAACEGERWLAECPSPFWGRPGTRKPIAVETQRAGEVAGAKSPFQIAGAGAVGTGSIRGMPQLARLRAGGFAIWPFDEPRLPFALEIYPRALTGPVVKSRPSARAEALEGLALCEEHRRLAIGSEDAFDAAVSALAMQRRLDELCNLPAATHADAAIEGQIWS